MVLLIDDKPDDVRARADELEEKATVLLRSPSDVRAQDLRRAHVVLVDYRITEWPERDAQRSIALMPFNGVALASVLRSYAEEKISKVPRVFAIHSGVLYELSGGLPARAREHAIARSLNLEWVFSKQQGTQSPTIEEQVGSLAAAAAALPRDWPSGSEAGGRTALRLLKVPGRAAWALRARADVESCHPPAHAWAAATNGLAFLRWILHQILPYPCFLWDDHYLAARLRVTPISLRTALSRERRAMGAMAAVQYRGLLESFLGKRWWRAGVEALLWRWTRGNPFSADALRAAVRARVSPNVEFVDLPQPVVCVDNAFRPTDSLVDVSAAVEVRPDDWPAYAEQAWVERAVAEEDPELAALVVEQDRDRLKSTAQPGGVRVIANQVITESQ